MIQLSALNLYEWRLEAPVKPWIAIPGIELDVWDSPEATGAIGCGWNPDAEERLRNGESCAVARHGSEVVSYCWSTDGPAWVGEINRLVVPEPPDVYLYDAFTLPPWRGRGLFRVLLSRLLAMSRERGRRRALIFALASNRASCRAIEGTGFERFHVVWRIEAWGQQGVWLRRSRLKALGVVLVTPEQLATVTRGPARRRIGDGDPTPACCRERGASGGGPA
jgi:GNAT superfamily N-acetyltransferase